MPFAELSTGIRMHYEQIGTGTPILAIHGWLGTPRTQLNTVIDALSADYQVIAPTLRGYGESRPPQRDFPHDFYYRDADDVLALMDVLKIDKAHIFGYSDGGEVALIAAGKAAARFYSVSTVGSVGYFGPAMRPAAQRSASAAFLSDDPELMALHGITNARAFVADWIEAVVYMIDRGGDVSLSLAPSIRCPVMLMLGDRDTLNPQAFGERLAAALPDGQVVMFSDCGHAIHDEQPAKFQAALKPFLAANTP